MLISETRCECSDGHVVVATLLNGVEYVTDAAPDEEPSAWAERVRQRAKDLPTTQRLLVTLRLREILSDGRLSKRMCTACSGNGWLFRLYRDGVSERHEG